MTMRFVRMDQAAIVPRKRVRGLSNQRYYACFFFAVHADGWLEVLDAPGNLCLNKGLQPAVNARVAPTGTKRRRSHSLGAEGGIGALTVDRREGQEQRLPWWTWLVPVLVCHLGTQFSLHFNYAPGVALLYLPIPLGMAMVQWWGPRVLAGVYLNAVLCAGWWGLPQVAWWPLYAVPETLAVGLSWLLFNRMAGGRCWMPEPKDLFSFLLFAIVPAACVDGLQVPLQLVVSGELAPADFPRLAMGEWTATAFSGIGVALPLLYFATPCVERWGLSLGSGAVSRSIIEPGCNARWPRVELASILGLAFVFAIFLSAGPHWYVYAVLGLCAGLRFGLGSALLLNVWIVFVTLIAPAILPGANQDSIAGAVSVFNVHIGLAVVCTVSSITGSITGSLREELRNRRAAESELRESEFLFRSQFDKGNIGIAIIGPDHRWLRVNEKLLSMFGYSEDEMTSTTWSELTHPDDLAECIVQFDRAIAGEIDDYAMYKRYLRKDGTILRAHVTVACFRDNSNVARFNIASLLDVTEQWQLEEQLRQSQKMEAVGQLAGGVAHDFNNLLQAILGCGDMALEHTQPDSPIYEDLKEIVQTAHRASGLVRQLLAFSRRQMLELKNLRLDDIVHDMSSMLRRLIREDIVLRIDTCASNCLIRADRSQIEQIVVNLCVNARDAMPGSGEITVRTMIVRRPGEVGRDQGDQLCLSVTDMGCGMDDATKSHIFEPFFTTKGPGQGSGLGLATVYGIVRQHSADIEVDSMPGEGTTVRIYFPIAEGRETLPDAQRSPVHRGSSESILIAEDDEIIRNLAVRTLQSAGYNVVPVADGEAALEVLRTRAVDFDLVMLDVVMPRTGGRAVYDYIQTTRPSLPVLFVSGYNAGEIHSGFVLNEGLSFIQKPYRRVELLHRIREILGPNSLVTPPAL